MVWDTLIYLHIFFEKLIRMAIFMVSISSNKDPILGTWPSPVTGQTGIDRTNTNEFNNLVVAHFYIEFCTYLKASLVNTAEA